MSALAGIYHLNAEPINLEDSMSLMEPLYKFSVDDVQTWHHDQIFLSNHAQWITPESVDERNPYYDSERRLAITADAIIDNRKELFDRLHVEHGLRQRMPDSKLILLAYDKWGEEAPKYLVGDFAFMIWDEKKRMLFGARDFSGSRTLYFYKNQNRFAFCTIIQPLLSLPYVAKRLNEQWIAEYLANPGVIETVDGTSTVFNEIEQVPPSHSISVFDGKIVFSRYCTITKEERLKLKSNKEYEEAFLDVFQNAVNARLRTHRPVGAFLSGGLDSGSVVSLAARQLHMENKRLYTYSYIPVDDYIDWTPKSKIANERDYIQSTVKHVGNISDDYLDFKGKSPLTEVDDWLDMLEMPYKIFLNSFWIKGINEKAHQQGVGVLLTGARGNNTISWGSALSHYAMLLKKMKWIRLYQEMIMYSNNNGVRKSIFMKTVTQKAYPFLTRIKTPQSHYLFPKLINPEFAQKTDVYMKLQKHGIDTTGFSTPKNIYLARKKHFEQTFVWNLNGTYGTKASLRYSLWNRDPTNDLRVIKFCLSVPEEQYVQNGMDRALIRRSTENLLPDNVRLNQKIRGVQGADGIHRMVPAWNSFIAELQQISDDSEISRFLNIPVIKESITKIQGDTRPETPFDADYNILMRSLILNRFIKSYA
ncbi:lasso peptide isopeptide bond-forming cyclase [Paenibacillus sp. sgz302251]|uniref:lasso peptide isopeptide bond-forming cyclase n=1 Tax=Paenibacillus sp. sgz302251 TaxID=3414493 RepID=UPI003C7A4509